MHEIPDVEQFFQEHGEVAELEIDEEFLLHLRDRSTYDKHRVSAAKVVEVHALEPRYFTNLSGRRAPIIMIGPTSRKRFLCVPIEPTRVKGVWRVVTAFQANSHHVQAYHNH